MELPGTLLTQAQKIKKVHPKKTPFCFENWNFLALILKNLLYSTKMEFSSSDNKQIVIFSQKKAFHIFQKMGTPKKLFFSLKIKLFLHFWKPSFLIFQKELPKPQKPKFNILLQSFIFFIN